MIALTHRAGSRDLEIAPTIGNRDLEIAPTDGDRSYGLKGWCTVHTLRLLNRNLEIAPTVSVDVVVRLISEIWVSCWLTQRTSYFTITIRRVAE